MSDKRLGARNIGSNIIKQVIPVFGHGFHEKKCNFPPFENHFHQNPPSPSQPQALRIYRVCTYKPEKSSQALRDRKPLREELGAARGALPCRHRMTVSSSWFGFRSVIKV